MTKLDHVERTRQLIAEARQLIAEAERTRWYHECARRGLEENLCSNLLHRSGLNGHLVEFQGTRFIADKWVETDDGPLVTGRYINKKGKVSPTWTGSAPPEKVKSLGVWKANLNRT